MAKHDPNEVALVADVYGECKACHHKGQARLVAYYSGEVVIRCDHCKRAGQFEVADKRFNDPKWFAPWLDTEGDEQ